LKIAILIPEFPSQTHAFFWREIQALRSLNVDVVLVSTRRPSADACRHDFAAQAAQETIYLFPPDWVSDTIFLLLHPGGVIQALRYIFNLQESSWTQRLSAMLLLLPAARLCRLAHATNFNHLHVHSFANSAHVAALAKLLGGSEFSLALHGDLEVYGKDHASKVKIASFIRCVTLPLKQSLLDRAVLPPSKIHLLWMGVDTKQFSPKERPIRLKENPFRMLTVARLHVNKGHRFALQAVQKLKGCGMDVRYTIVGDGPAQESISDQVKSLGLSDVVEMVGTKSEADIFRLLQSSDALLLTSVGMGEAAPVAVMEAMACALPVVCSVIGGTRDMINHGHDGFLVPQEDVDAIATCIMQLIDNPELALQIGKAARIRAVQSFDSHALAQMLTRFVASGDSCVQLDIESRVVD
jgi:colanic acid/amylovoran biosynthesis glycosyltransferase